jgi:hypothetical protein
LGCQHRNRDAQNPRRAFAPCPVQSTPSPVSPERHMQARRSSRRFVMTPLQVAKEHCSNFDCGRCLGVYYNDDLTPQFCRPLQACLLGEPFQRCPYFENVVMRITTDDSSSAGAKRREEFDEGIREYKFKAGLIPPATRRLCPDCKRRSLEEGKKFCAICRDNRRRQTIKLANRRRGRAKTDHDYNSSAKMSIDCEGFTKPIFNGEYQDSGVPKNRSKTVINVPPQNFDDSDCPTRFRSETEELCLA